VTNTPKVTTSIVALAILLVACSSGQNVMSKAANGEASSTSARPSVTSADLAVQSVADAQADRQTFGSVKELAQNSVAVLTGKVTDAGAPYVLDGSSTDGLPGVVVTPFTFLIDSVVAGDQKLFSTTATFTQRGGTTPSARTPYGDDVPVKVGDNLLLFVGEVNGTDIGVGQAGRFTIDGDRIVVAAARYDGASVELKSRPLSAVAGLIRAQLGKKPPVVTPAFSATTLPPGPIVVTKASSPPTSAP
jgi:hypothetical protein